MAEKKISSGGATYENVDSAYLAQRKLRKSAGWVLLWALGVGAVISGLALRHFTQGDVRAWTPLWLLPAAGTAVVLAAFLACFRAPRTA